MEMWWRAAALDALQAYIAGPLSRADGREAASLQRTVALLLAPTLEAICSHAAMQASANLHDRSLSTQIPCCCCRCQA